MEITDVDREVLKELARLKDANFLKAIYGLLMNNNEKRQMANNLKRLKDITHHDVEKILLMIVNERKM